MGALKILCPQAALVKEKDGGSLALGIILSVVINFILTGVVMIVSFVIGFVIGLVTMGIGTPIAGIIGFVLGLLPLAHLVVSIIACINNYSGKSDAKAAQTDATASGQIYDNVPVTETAADEAAEATETEENTEA